MHLSDPYKVVARSTSHLYAATVTFAYASYFRRRVMQPTEWDFHSSTEKDEDDTALPETPEERVDRYGVATALFVLCVAFFIAAIWVLTQPSFEKCSTLENAAERNACFDTLRQDQLQPAAKGPGVGKF
jgi:hypothetical protein